MDNPKYVFSAISPFGMPLGFQDFLATRAFSSTGEDLTNRELIAGKLLALYKHSNLPFCCTYLGWISRRYPAELLEQALRIIIENFGDETNGELLLSEGFAHETDKGFVQIIGAYPLFEVEEEFRISEYREVSFLENKQFAGDLLSWSISNLLDQAIDEMEFGILIGILGEDTELIEKKQREIENLLKEALGLSGL